MGASVSAGSSTAPRGGPFFFSPGATVPDWENQPKFDPNYGFDGKKRKEREPPLTKEQLISAKVEPKFRDFCAHKMLQYKKCNKDNFPWVLMCKHEKHEYEQCQHDEFIIRMKEFERERRLLHRQKRKGKKPPVCQEEPKKCE